MWDKRTYSTGRTGRALPVGGGAQYSTTERRGFQLQKTFKLKITTTRRRAVTLSPLIVRAFCAACQGEAPTLTCWEAAQFLGIDEQGLGELIALGKVHATGTVRGTFRVCQNSLTSE